MNAVVQLTDAWRLVTNGAGSNCDYNSPNPMHADTNLDSARWYQFSGGAGWRMAMTPPNYNSCGTNRPGWLATPLPAIGEPAEPGRVCYRTSSSSSTSYQCGASTNILVCTCSMDGTTPMHFYKLPRPPSCNYAYCGEPCTSSSCRPPQFAKLNGPLTASSSSSQSTYTYEAWVRVGSGSSGRLEIFGGTGHGFYLIEGYGNSVGCSFHVAHVGYSNAFGGGSSTLGCLSASSTWYHIAAVSTVRSILCSHQ